jgi:WD40 repeat protein/tRNA A-37 threonylcarbamoyl transferase component Bud32
MASPATTAEFIGLIRKVGLIDEETLATVALGLPREPVACADALVDAALLTPFQAKQLLSGRPRGLVLGPYRILRPLGKGGMGVVYLADHAALARKVALKVLIEEQSREKLALERFFREARSAAALDHPNIVRLHDIARNNDTHYLVMEYVEGTDLQALLEQTGTLHAAQAAGYIAQAAAGLQHAHDRGFIHRDIKPANLIIARTGVVKVLDMGLARSVTNPKDALTGQLDEDAITGTADFLSPEQALNVRLDKRTDIYSLGGTFYTLLTGRTPYEGTTAQKLAQHQTAAPPDVRAIRLDVPPELAAVVARMMAKRPDERYQTAREVLAALAPWAPGVDAATRETVAVEPSASTTEMRDPNSSAPTVVGLTASGSRAAHWKRAAIGAGCAAVLLTAGLLYAVFGRSQPAPEPAGDAEAAPAAPVQPTAALPVPPLAKDFRWLIGHTAEVNDLVVSPDETRLASLDWSGKLVIWNLRTGERVHECPTRPGARGLVCTTSPDGQFVLVSGERMPILVFEWATGREVRAYPAHESATWGLAVSPSGEQLLSCGADGLVILRKFPSGDEVRRFEFEAKTVWAAVFSADGTKIAAACGAGATAEESYLVRVWNAADGKQLHQFTGHSWDVRTIAFRPDGGALAAGGFDGTVRLWDLNTGAELRTIVAHDGVVERVFFLPGGQRLLTCGGPMQGVKPTWEGGSVKVWDADTGREIKGWKGNEWSDLISLAPFSQGRSVVAGGRDRTVRVWSLTDAPADRLTRADKPIYAFDFSGIRPFKFEYRDGQPGDPDWRTRVPSGVYLRCWKEESAAEFRAGVEAGRPWIGVTNLNADWSCQMIFQFDEGLTLQLPPGKRYSLRAEYRTANEGQGRVYIQNPKNGEFPSILEVQLERTDGQWKSMDVTFRRPPEGRIDILFVNTAVGEGNALAVRAVEVFESPEDGK